MPYSDPANKDWTLKEILALAPKSILDVGAGSGTYGHLLRNGGYDGALVAVEVWEPYLNRFGLNLVYDEAVVEDVRSIPQEFFDKFDLVIFGDVLEHMTKEEALEVWTKVRGHAIISIPIIHYPQGEEEGNPYEAHVEDHWTTADVLETFEGIESHREFEVTGVFTTWKSLD